MRAVRRRTGTDWAIRIDGESYTAQRITVLLLRKLKRDAEASVGEELTDAVIAVPAPFGEAQREETREAGRLAGFNVLRVVSESSLAGLGHAVGNGGRDQTVLVVRCGAGSFDASLLEIDGANGVTGAVVKAVCGDDNLGGDDWDRAVADELAARFNSLHGIDLTRDETAAARLREAVGQARIDLSSASESTAELAYAGVTAEGRVHLHDRLTRDWLRQLTRGPLKQCEMLLRGLLKDSGPALGDIDQVVLVGGATRTPAFVGLLRELTGGREPARSADADGLAAAGAVLQAGLLKGVRRDILLVDAVALDLGVETQGGA
ncbi:Hsp70 family protein [Streptomyces sp. NPDC002994]|uniref:Hsp70 family protein n=1 Tax=Streptomyces sp. NPDC002994 TaxID=3154441 RepID=UPI0033A0C21A